MKFGVTIISPSGQAHNAIMAGAAWKMAEDLVAERANFNDHVACAITLIRCGWDDMAVARCLNDAMKIARIEPGATS